MDQSEQAGSAIVAADDWMRRALADCEDRYERASNAGAELAAEVYRYTEDPDALGLDALRDAWSWFMGQHSGNFGPPLTAG